MLHEYSHYVLYVIPQPKAVFASFNQDKDDFRQQASSAKRPPLHALAVANPSLTTTFLHLKQAAAKLKPKDIMALRLGQGVASAVPSRTMHLVNQHHQSARTRAAPVTKPSLPLPGHGASAEYYGPNYGVLINKLLSYFPRQTVR